MPLVLDDDHNNNTVIIITIIIIIIFNQETVHQGDFQRGPENRKYNKVKRIKTIKSHKKFPTLNKHKGSQRTIEKVIKLALKSHKVI